MFTIKNHIQLVWRRLTEPETLSQYPSPGHILFRLQLSKGLVAGKHQDIHQVHDAVDEGDANVQW